jgi:hypothetical protein
MSEDVLGDKKLEVMRVSAAQHAGRHKNSWTECPMIFCWSNEIICRIASGFLQAMLAPGTTDWVHSGAGSVDGSLSVS